MQSSTEKELNENLSTEGDQVLVPIRCTSKVFPPKPLWRPFSTPVVFYDPEEHVDIAKALQFAPIRSSDEEVKSFE